MHVDIGGATRVARLAAEFDWTWSVDDIPRFCKSTGWEILQSGEYGAELRTDLQVQHPTASAFWQKRTISYITIDITDSAENDFSERVSGEHAVEGFTDLSAALTAVLGAPSRHAPGADATVGWNAPDAVINLSSIPDAINLHIVNPEYQAWLDEPEDE